MNKALEDQIQQLKKEFINLIKHKLGILIHEHQTSDLNKTIKNACIKFNLSPQDYLQMLKNSTEHSPHLEYLISGITVGETYFFRDKAQMKLLEEMVLPNLIKARRLENKLSLRVWSAGCASGEEIYTIAMMLCELLPDFNKWTLNLLGTDINPEVLKKAIAGTYSEWSMRSIPDYYKNKYFTLRDQKYVLSQYILDVVNFDYLNLNEECYPSIFNNTNAQDLILCRNVLIYFDTDRVQQLMYKFNQSLIPGGYLLLGASDPINTNGTNFIFHYQHGLLFSRPLTETGEVIEKAFEKEVKNKLIPKAVLPKRKPAVPHQVKKPITNQRINLDKKLINQLLSEAQWDKVLYEISHLSPQLKRTAFILLSKATALANVGKLEEAQTLFEEYLALEPTNRDAYFTYALTLAELNCLDQAENAFRKTLFLDHQFVPAHYQLGLLLLRMKQNASGLKSLRNALMISKTKPAQESIPGVYGLSYGRLAEILSYELELHSIGKNYVNSN